MMFTTNPFTPLTTFVSPGVMQGYIVLMVLAVVAGTAFDLLNEKKSSSFFRTGRAQRRPQSGHSAPRTGPPSRPGPSPTTSQPSASSATSSEGFPMR